MGDDLIKWPYLLYVSGHIHEQTPQPRSDVTQPAVWSESTLFATHPAILHTFTGSKMNFLKRRLYMYKVESKSYEYLG